ncbi:MAG: MFS transporter [Spirochaetes bacterium]|nr:MFS transporter [Spirochaetota bacterium]
MKKPKYLMILLFFVSFAQTGLIGCFLPVFSVYLKDYLKFSGSQTGMILGISVIASIFATLIITGITGKTKLDNRNMIIILHSMAALFAVIFTFQHSFILVLAINLLYTFSLGPTNGLINGFIFASLGDQRKRFGLIRLGGTIGWIASGWGFGFVYLRLLHNNDVNYLSHSFYFAAFFSLLVIILVFFIPSPEADARSAENVNIKSGKLSLAWLHDSRIRNILIVFLLAGLVDVFYYFGVGPYLKSRGYLESDISPLMTLGQITEICALFFLEKIVKKIGYKNTVLLGLAAQMLRYFLFAAGVPLLGLPFIILLHGFVVAFLYTTVTMMIDSMIGDEVRSSVHQIIAMLWTGVASSLGNLLAGFSMDFSTSGGKTVQYGYFWLVPAVGTAAALILMMFSVRPDSRLSSVKEISDRG